jgi:hypothetical protein
MRIFEHTIDEDEFDKTYALEKNPFDENAGWDGCMFETYGEELEYVQNIERTSSHRVWTIVESDEGMAIISGMHYVNRFGYLVTQQKYTNQTIVELIN